MAVNLYPLVENGENPPDVQDIAPSIEGRILNDVVIPDFLTVHLGRPNVSAPNVRVLFIDYVRVRKNTILTKEIGYAFPTCTTISHQNLTEIVTVAARFWFCMVVYTKIHQDDFSIIAVS